MPVLYSVTMGPDLKATLTAAFAYAGVEYYDADRSPLVGLTWHHATYKQRQLIQVYDQQNGTSVLSYLAEVQRAAP